MHVLVMNNEFMNCKESKKECGDGSKQEEKVIA